MAKENASAQQAGSVLQTVPEGGSLLDTIVQSGKLGQTQEERGKGKEWVKELVDQVLQGQVKQLYFHSLYNTEWCHSAGFFHNDHTVLPRRPLLRLEV